MDDSAPIGIKLLRRCCRLPATNRHARYKWTILVLTFIAYACYHMTRRPISMVKGALHPTNCSGFLPDSDAVITNKTANTWCAFPPFNGSDQDASKLFGYLDALYLSGYAVAMFVSGAIAERMHLRYFLSLGMLLSAFTTYLFGMGYYVPIHQFYFYALVQLIGGICQSSGWPSVVTCVGNWFGKKKRGLIFGIWNAHTSVGNIMGAYIGGAVLTYNWGLSFIVPAMVMGVAALIMFLFLAPYPEEIGQITEPSDDLQSSMVPAETMRSESMSGDERRSLLACSLNKDESSDEKNAITFYKALCIPGVVDFSLSLFFCKLVSYTFLFWLPLYLKLSTDIDSASAANLSAFFEYGGIAGGIIAGHLSDTSNASATTCIAYLVLTVPMMFIFKSFGGVSLLANKILQIFTGFLVNGPYALITTAVTAELGTHPSIAGSAKALATVTAIIDGTGSIGAALGPFLAGQLSSADSSDWNGVFYMMMGADVFALICLIRMSSKEIGRIREKRRATNILS